MRARARQRCGGIYVAVLMTAMIVAVIGISALSVNRVQFRSSEGANNVTAARFYAQSAVEMGMLSVSSDVSWRSTYSHDAWEPEQSIGNGTFTWKLVDEYNGDLAADPSNPVRLYGKGSVGEAVRIYSMLIQEVDDASSNLLSNPGMEAGTTDWVGEDCTISEYTADQHSGAKSLAVTGRWDYYSGPYQDLTSTIEIGTTYDIEVWAKMKTGTSPVRIVMWVGSEWWWDGFDGQWLVGDDTWVGSDDWTLVTATLTPTWSGAVNAAYVKVDTSFGSTGFYVDDAAFQVAGTETKMVAVPGSWRWDVE